MFFYIILGICCMFVLFHIFLKLTFRFWSMQPVFHLHNLRYWLWPPGLLQHGQPPKTKYYHWAIECDTFKNSSTEKKALFYFLIKSHFLYQKKAKYNPPKTAVLDYFKCHDTSSYLSLHYDSINRKLISCMTSRPLYCHIEDRKLEVSYVDFLCVHKKHRKMGIAPKQIYTHYYKSRELGAAPIFLFKREGNVNLMVPLTVYYAYVFSTRKWTAPNFNLPNNITCHLITTANIELLFHYFEEIKSGFSCVIIPGLSHIKHLIEQQLLLPCILMDNKNVVGVYFYRYPHTTYSKKKSIECVASYVSPGYEDIFIDSFPNTIVLLKTKVSFDLIIVENISNNNIIIKNIMENNKPKWKCPMAYYFYNFIYRPFFSTNVFLLN